jgi:hypothetical protein
MAGIFALSVRKVLSKIGNALHQPATHCKTSMRFKAAGVGGVQCNESCGAAVRAKQQLSHSITRNDRGNRGALSA